MKTIYIKTQITWKDTAKGLFAAVLEFIQGVLLTSFILGMIFSPFIIYFVHKTSDQDFCSRVASAAARTKLHCPQIKTLVKE